MSYFDQFEKYNLSIFHNGARLPEIKISPEEKKLLNLEDNCSNKDYLKTLAWNGYLEKSKAGLIKKSKQECIDRLKFEFEVFDKTGTIDYILLLMKIFLWCDKNDIPRGPSRGSAGGSFALYLLDLIYINPLDHDLNFTRFLNEARAKPKYIDGILYVDGKTFADFDGDVSNIGRGRLVENVEKVFHGKTCKILTIQYLTGKTALKDTVKSYLEYGEQDSLEITNNIESLFGKVDSLNKTLEKSKAIQDWVKESDKNQEAFAIAKKIEGLIRGVGQHASGVFLSYYPVEDIVPTELSAKENEIVAGYDMEVVLTLGLKADVLGLKTLDYIKTAADLVGIKFQNINVNDQSIYDYFASNNLYYGLFQVEDGLTKSVVAKVKPKNIDQLAACISISRPGALKHIDEYVKYVNNGERKLIYPEIDKVLEQTGGIILYQEQINRICQEVYKLSPTDSDEIRRAIGKKQKDEMAKWEPILYIKGKENNISDVITKWFWDTCNASADYLFNASHCYAYSYITAYTTYFKANHPFEFFMACLKMAQYEDKPLDCIDGIQSELPYFNITLLPPDILKSKEDYSLDGKNIRMGINAIKGLAGAALPKIQSFQAAVNNKFDLFINLTNAKIPVNVAASLILSGCFDSIRGNVTRNKLLLEFELWKQLKEKELVHCYSLGSKYNYDLIALIKEMALTLKNEKGKPLIKDTRFETIKRDYDPAKQKFLRNSAFEELCAYIMETEYLGFSYSYTLKNIYQKWVKDLSTVTEVNNTESNTKVRFVAIIKELKKKISKKKTPYISLELRDERASIKAMIFKEDRIEASKEFNKKDLEEGDIIIVNGMKKDEVVFIDSVSIQDNPIVIKKSDLKNEKQKT